VIATSRQGDQPQHQPAPQVQPQADPPRIEPQTPVVQAPPAQPQAPVVTDPAATLSLDPAPQATATPSANADAAVDVPDLGDNGLNLAADYFVNTLGLALDGRELTEAAKGNFHLLEAKIEVLGDKAKGAGSYVQLARESVARVQEAERTKLTATVTAVHEAVGGEENWKAVQNFARTNLSPEDLKAAQATLTAGGFGAVAMARHLLSLASTNPNVTVKGQPATQDGPTVSLQGHAPLNREQYREEYRKLCDKLGIHGAARSEELKALNARYTG